MFARRVTFVLTCVLLGALTPATAELDAARTLGCIHDKAVGAKGAAKSAKECLDWSATAGSECFVRELDDLLVDVTACCARDHAATEDAGLAARCAKHLADETLLPEECTHDECIALISKPVGILHKIQPHFNACVMAARTEPRASARAGHLRDMPAVCRLAQGELTRAAAQLRAVSRKGKGKLYVAKDEL